MAIPLLAPVITFLAGSAFRKIATSLGIVTLLKAFIGSIIITVLPLVLFKTWLIIQSWIITEVMTRAGDIIGEPTSFTIQLTGFAAWAGDLLKLPQCVSVIVSAVITRFCLRPILWLFGS